MKADEIKNIGPFSMLIPGNEEGKVDGMTWSDSMMLTQTKYEGWVLPSLTHCTYILEMKKLGVCNLPDTIFWTSVKSNQDIIIFKSQDPFPKCFGALKPGNKIIPLLIKNNWQ